ncbi:hypothetical protein COV93_07165 [Candidatus Woesearchaeota archaeon CG11_big_fil_rev_8_21_14_0_20_43_8]|nr:MAG: hypothetical protein COV93_07165 [Candidatus Woesearchaeota archaeon CG11_big_fil_rev_8_21_14_0_20_43_8]
MRAGILIMISLVFFVLAVSASATIICQSVEECPMPSCIGSVRACENMMCDYTPCLFTGSMTPDEAGDTERDDFEYYSKLAGLGNGARDSHTASNNILQRFTIMNKLKSSKISWTLVGGALFLVLIIVIRKTGRLGKLALAFVAVMIIIGSAIQLGLNTFSDDPNLLWKKSTASDYLHAPMSDYEEMDYKENERNAVSPYLVDLRQNRRIHGNRESSITILEFENADDVEDWKMIKGYSLKRKNTYGESVYTAKIDPLSTPDEREVTIWDEDRFVFVAVGDANFNNGEVIRIVKKYPYKSPTFLSKLMIKDDSPPEIFDLFPGDGSAAKDNSVSFTVSDDLYLLKDTVKVTGISGFDLDHCSDTEDSEGIRCSFETTFNPGLNYYVITAEDRSGNQGRKGVSIYMDSMPPKIIYISPTLGEYTNNTNFTMVITDDFSMDRAGVEIRGLEGFRDGKTDCFYLNKTTLKCRFVSEPKEGANNLKILLRDSAGNEVQQDHYFNYLTAAKIKFVYPLPNTYTNKNTISFIVSDSSGIEQKSILISHGDDFEDIIDECLVFGKGFNINYNCQKKLDLDYGGNTVTISVMDTEGSVFKIPLNFIYDNKPPVIKDIDIDTDKSSAYIEFNITDERAGVDIDTFNLLRLEIFDMDMDCAPNILKKDYSCYIDFPDLEPGDYEFDIQINDRAGNSKTQEVKFKIES